MKSLPRPQPLPLALNMAMPSTASTSKSSARTPFHGCSSGFLRGTPGRACAAAGGAPAGGACCRRVHRRPTPAPPPAAQPQTMPHQPLNSSLTTHPTHRPSCRYCRHLMEAWPAAAEASPTPSRPPMGPNTGVAQDTRSAMPAACAGSGGAGLGRATGRWSPHPARRARGRLGGHLQAVSGCARHKKMSTQGASASAISHQASQPSAPTAPAPPSVRRCRPPWKRPPAAGRAPLAGRWRPAGAPPPCRHGVGRSSGERRSGGGRAVTGAAAAVLLQAGAGARAARGSPARHDQLMLALLAHGAGPAAAVVGRGAVGWQVLCAAPGTSGNAAEWSATAAGCKPSFMPVATRARRA